MSAGDCWVQWVDSVMKLSHPFQHAVLWVCWSLQQHLSYSNVKCLSVLHKMFQFTIIQIFKSVFYKNKMYDRKGTTVS